MTTSQTKWWWPLFKPWEIKQSFTQKVIVFGLLVTYFTIAVLSSANTLIFGSPSKCLPKKDNSTQSEIDMCHEYDLDKNDCQNHSMCRITYNGGAVFGILFFWAASLYMFIGFFRTTIWPALNGFKERRQQVTPSVTTPPGITNLEYDAL